MNETQLDLDTMDEILDTIDSEGGVEGGAFSYFGRNLDSPSQHINYLWREAYDAYVALDAALDAER